MSKRCTSWLSRTDASLLFACAVLALVTHCQVVYSQAKRRTEEPTESTPLFLERTPPQTERIIKQQAADERRITIRQANLFYYRFLERCVSGLPDQVTVQYCGILSWGSAHPKWKATANVGIPLGWDVLRDGVGVFSIWISTGRTAQTVNESTIEGQKLFINVSSIQGGRGVNQKLIELGGRSVREVLLCIEKPRETQEGARPLK